MSPRLPPGPFQLFCACLWKRQGATDFQAFNPSVRFAASSLYTREPLAAPRPPRTPPLSPVAPLCKGSCHRQVTEGLKALRSGKASAFLPAQNETKQKAPGNPGVFYTFSAIACGNVRARQGVAKAEARLTFRPSIPQSRIRVTAPFTQGSLWCAAPRFETAAGGCFR